MKAKTKLTKLWSILLVLVMVVGMLPTVALAAEPATEKADFSTDPGKALSLLNAAKTGTEDSTWDPDTNTLTLNGVNFTTTASTAVKLPKAATIVLNGDNIIISGEARSKDSFGIYALGDLTIKGAGKLTVTSGTANDDSHGIHAGDSIAISGNVTAIGGGAGEYSHGICASYDVTIFGGTVIAQAGSATTARALNNAPSTLPTSYQWRTSESDAYDKFPDSAYTWNATHTYLEIKEPEYTVTFDANGGTDTMADVTGVLGDYTLPANGFTAPEGKQFKCWSVGGTEKAVGDKITVAADTTVKAVWENIPAAPIEYEILEGANSSWTQDSDGNLSVRGSGAFSEFVGVKVDGKSVDEKYYTVKEGSIIVTLKADYLNTLTVGSHTLEIIWTDGSASTAFTVSGQTVVESPQTGDNNSIALWIALLFVSGFGVVATAVYGKKRKSVK